MKLKQLVDRASDFFAQKSSSSGMQSFRNMEIIYCRTDVCFHSTPVCGGRCHHQLGYLTLWAPKISQAESDALLLTWIPNSTTETKNEVSDDRDLSPCGHSGQEIPENSGVCSPHNKNRGEQLGVSEKLQEISSRLKCAGLSLLKNEQTSKLGLLNKVMGRSTSESQMTGSPTGLLMINLGEMRSLSIFYEDKKCTLGQLILMSNGENYKVLYFHHGGLDNLVEMIHQHWIVPCIERGKPDMDKFLIVQSHFSDEQLHPEEGTMTPMNHDVLESYLDDKGRINNDLHLRKVVFFAGVDPTVRSRVWPFLLECFPFHMTGDERKRVSDFKRSLYDDMMKQRNSMSESVRGWFEERHGHTIEKDVLRTDRQHPYFRGDKNPNLDRLHI